MKKTLQMVSSLLLLVLISSSAWGQLTLTTSPYEENFDGIGTALPTGWTVRTGATASTLGTEATTFTSATTAWNNTSGAFKNLASADGLTSTSLETEQNASADRALGLRQTSGYGNPGGAFVLQLANTTGLGEFVLSFKLQSLDAATAPRTTTWLVDYGIGDAPTAFTTVTTTPASLTTGNSTFHNTDVSVTMPIEISDLAETVWIRVVTLSAATGSGNRPTSAIDDVSLTFTDLNSQDPAISISAAALSGFSYVEGAGPSAEQSFTISGNNLTNDISLAAPTNFEISTDSEQAFSANNPIVLQQSGGAVGETTIYVRMKEGLSSGSYNSEDITISSTNATSKTISLSGTVIPPSYFYRSKVSGNWSDASTWEKSNDEMNWSAASITPTALDYTITIQNGHTVTLSASVSADEIVVNAGGQLTIPVGMSLSLANGADLDLVIDGTVLNSGTISLSSGATWAINNGGTFIHNTTSAFSSMLSSATLDNASTIIYRGGSNVGFTPSISGRTYGNLTLESESGTWSPNGSGSSALTINGNLTIGGTGEGTLNYNLGSFNSSINIAGDLIVTAGSILTCGANSTVNVSGGSIDKTSTLTINGTLANTNPITVESGSTLAILGSMTGQVSISRNTTGNLGYSFIGAPVSDGDAADITANYFYQYTESTGAFTEPTGILTPGKGYLVAYNTPSPVVAFTGTPNTGTVALDITKATDGFNLVANPYTAPISISSFLAGNSAVNGAVYFWDDGGSNVGQYRGGDYIAANGAGATSSMIVQPGGSDDQVDGSKGASPADNGFIPSMQGVFVEAVSSGAVSFTTSMIATTAGANGDANYYRQNAENKQRIRVGISGNGLYNEVLLAFMEAATQGVDFGLDAKKYSGNNLISFYSLIGEEKFAIQSLPVLNPSSEVVIPFGFNLAEAGEYEFVLNGVEGIGSEYSILAIDQVTGITHNLTENGSFKFSSSAVSGDQRFKLVLQAASILSSGLTVGNDLTVAKISNGLALTANAKNAQEVAIYTVDGKVLFHDVVAFQNGKANINVNLSENRIYILKANNQSIKFILK